MDDILNSSIFDSQLSFEDYLIQFTSSQPQVAREGTGAKCELAEYDCLYNLEGNQVFLRSGTKYDLRNTKSMQITDDESAIARTTFWDANGAKSFVQTEIRSPYMKTALKAIVPEYKDRNLKFNHIYFIDKPQHLFHFRDELFGYGRKLEHGSDDQRHVSLLVEHLQQELADAISTYTIHVEFDSPPSIDFIHFWTIFKQGDLVYLSRSVSPDGVELVVRYKSVELDCSCDKASHRLSHSWSFHGDYLDTNGKNLGYRKVAVSIPHFDGFRELEQLAVLPLRFHSRQDDIKTRLVARGQKFVELQGCHHRHFKGVARLLWGSQRSRVFEVLSLSTPQLISIDGRIMTDPETFYLGFFDNNALNGLIPSTSSLTEEQYLICRGHIGGFSFNEKKWGYFDVDHIEPVEFNGAIFTSSLMLENRYKNILLSLVRMQSIKSEQSFDDIIKGKGKGVVFLLHGEPGVGKTMTAESIADCCKRPLLRIDASSLCNSPESLEKGLARALRLAERWEAVALLDEADIFLEQRSQSYLRRNSLVTAFLRILEYYQGILFLTTNRINSFDRAFKSRIQVAIHYPPLNRASRQQLWQIFLSKASRPHRPENEWTDISEELASEELNGRQIRDVVRIAQASAFGEGGVIETRHLRDALDALRTFDEEFEKGRSPLESCSSSERKRRRMEYEDSDWNEDMEY